MGEDHGGAVGLRLVKLGAAGAPVACADADGALGEALHDRLGTVEDVVVHRADGEHKALLLQGRVLADHATARRGQGETREAVSGQHRADVPVAHETALLGAERPERCDVDAGQLGEHAAVLDRLAGAEMTQPQLRGRARGDEGAVA